MKCFHLCLLATSIGFRFAQANRLKDIKGNAEKVAELTPGYQLDEDKQWIIFPYDSGGEDLFRCDKGSGLAFTTIGNKEYAGCCPPGNKLFGSPDDKTWYCCAEGHEMSGSAEKGYQCCPKGYNYDGHKCAPGYDNTRCDSGILEGKCYNFKMENGHKLGCKNDGSYSAASDDKNHLMGKFRFCKSEACDSGTPVNPNESVRIQDIYGIPESGHHQREWLSDARDGAHIRKTPDYSKAGKFIITKWICGKFCLGGLEYGVGPACPNDEPAITINTKDPQRCTCLDLIEVPCDIRAVKNNCIWHKEPGSCGPGDSEHCKCPTDSGNSTLRGDTFL